MTPDSNVPRIGLLSEFRFAGRLGPIAAVAAIALTWHAAFGYSEGLKLFLMICAACAAAFLVLGLLEAVTGPQVSWKQIAPLALLSIVLAGLVAGAIHVAPNYALLLEFWAVLRPFLIGAASAAFFVGLALVTSAARRTQQLEYETRQRLLEAKLQTLTARIEPHFLMNTLANLSALVETEPRAANELLEHLTDLLKAALDQSRDMSSTLGQELKLIESYLAIMRTRLADKLRFSINIDEGIEDTVFPALLLQTLVENSVGHGIEPCTEGGTVAVKVKRDADDIVITVTDDGVGFDSEEFREGTGLQNTRERIESFFEGNASFEITSQQGTGTTARVTFPAEAR